MREKTARHRRDKRDNRDGREQRLQPLRRHTAALVAMTTMCGTALVGALALAPSPSVSAPATVINLGGRVTDPGFRGVVTSHSQQLGVARLADGRYGVCFDTGAGHPWPSGTPGSSLRTNPRVGYLLSMYLGHARTDGRYAAALWWATGLDLGVNRHPSAMRASIAQMRADSRSTYGTVRAIHDRLLADARSHAPGPRGYDTGGLRITSGTPMSVSGRVTGTGNVSGVGVRSASGAWLRGRRVSVTLSGATFASGTSNVWRGTTGTTPRTLTYRQSSPVAVTATMRVDGLPGHRYRLHDAHDTSQRVGVSAGLVTASRTVHAAASVGYARVRKVDATNGASLAGAVFSAWVDGNDNRVADPTEPVRTLTTADGYTPVVATFAGASVCFRETRPPAGYVVNPNVACATAGGTSTAPAAAVVEDRPLVRPEVSTQVNHQVATAGVVLVDRVKVAGSLGATITGGWRLLGPIAASDGACDGLAWTGAPIAASGTFTVRGDGSYEVGRHTATAAGCYTYSEALAPSATTLATGWTAPGLPTETSAVRPHPARVPAHPTVTAGGHGPLAPADRRSGTPAHVRIDRVRLDARLAPTRFRGSELPPPSDIRLGGLWAGGASLDAVAGTSVVVGHVSDDHDRPGAFRRLWSVRRGTVVATRDHGATMRWRVTSVRKVARGHLDRRLFSQSLGRRLVLITCADRVTHGGYFHYTSNEVVVAVPVQR